MWDISKILNASIYQPGTDVIVSSDIVRGKIVSRPEHWSLARRLSSKLDNNDLIFCAGEDVGFPIASLCCSGVKKPKILVFIHNINRPRTRLALKLLNLRQKIDLFMTCTPLQGSFLRSYLNLSPERIRVFLEQPTDVSFFQPGLSSNVKSRPLIASGGLEKRDYRTLADATQDLDIDVEISAVSPNAIFSKRAFPKIIPENMRCRTHTWDELLQLYRNSDVVAISLFQNKYQAGLTTMFEALACKRPVIITRSPGIIQEFIDLGAVTGVNPKDPQQLRQAILSLLRSPNKANLQAQIGYKLVSTKYNHRNYIKAFIKEIKSIT